MGSVAGQIRIDLIAQAAQFNAGLREGKQSLGSFREEFDKLNRSFESNKNVSARFQTEAKAWETAMRRLGGGGPTDWRDKFTGGAQGFFDALNPGKTSDAALRNETRWKSMVPWGNSLRVTMSAEAAATAAAIGSHKQNLIRELATAGQGLAGGIPGIGGALSAGLGMLMSPAGLALGATVGTAGYLGHEVYATAQDRDRRIREAHDAALQTGQSAGDISRLTSIGFDPMMISKFQKSLADQTPEQQKAFRKLGLSPEELSTKPMIEALSQVGEAFEGKVKNAADRSSVAMHLFGKAGYSVIETLAEMKTNMGLLGEHEIVSATDIERVKAYDHAVKEWANVKQQTSLSFGRAFGSESGIGTSIERGLAWLGSDAEGRKQIELQKEADE